MLSWRHKEEGNFYSISYEKLYANTVLCIAKNSDNILRKMLSVGGERAYDAYFETVIDQENGSTIRKRKMSSNCEVIDFFALNKGMTKEETIAVLNGELPDRNATFAGWMWKSKLCGDGDINPYRMFEFLVLGRVIS